MLRRVRKPSRTVPLVVSIVTVSVCGTNVLRAADRFRPQRLRMVEEFIIREGVKNPRVISAMRAVPRHEFVPVRLRRSAYQDGALAIGYRQTISPPFIVAYMTESIDPRPGDRVLEIGTGSGYQAAVLSRLAKTVYTIEIVPQLGRSAAKRLKRLHYRNVVTKIGDGYKGWPEHAPFDKIIVTCSPENVPQPLIDQLKERGRMIVPLGRRYQQVFYLFEKHNGKLVRTKLIPTLFVPMTGISEAKRSIKPDPLHPRIVNGDFETDSNADGRPDNWHYQRQCKLETTGAPRGKKFLCFRNTEPARLAQLLQGMAVDGRRIGVLKVSLFVRNDKTVAGNKSYEQPSLFVHFYDAVRRPIGNGRVGGWIGTSGWRRVSGRIKVPPKAREAIIRVGLNGATGTLCIDDIRLTPVRR